MFGGTVGATFNEPPLEVKTEDHSINITDLAVGDNTVTITVTSVKAATYNITIVRAAYVPPTL